MPEQDDQSLLDTKKFQLEVCKVMADSAAKRFASRREMEFKVCLAVWSTLAVLIAGVFAARHWNPTIYDALAASCVCVILVVVFWWYWLPYINEHGNLEIRQQFFWEACVVELFRENAEIPRELLPSNSFTGLPTDWTRLKLAARHFVANIPTQPLPEVPTQCACQKIFKIHRSQLVQLWITICLALILMVTMWQRSLSKFVDDAPTDKGVPSTDE